MSFLSRLGRAAKAAVDYHGATQYQVRGQAVVCPICGGDEFVMVADREVRKPLFSSRNVPWLELDRISTTLICTHCSHLLQFGRAPERTDDTQL